MRIDTASRLTVENEQQQATPSISGEAFKEVRVIQIEPDDEFESVLMAIRLQSEPVILLLPEQSLAFRDPGHFEQLRQICTPDQVSFALPPSRIGEVAPYAHQYGFSLASSLEKAAQTLPMPEPAHSQETPIPEANEETIGGKMEDLDVQSFYEQPTVSPERSSQPITPLPTHPPLAPKRKRLATRRISLIATLVALLVAVGAVLLPALFSAQPGLMNAINPASAPAITTVGQLAFTSSGQLDPSSTIGLNDIVTISLHNLSLPAAGQGYYGWLLPDLRDDKTQPLLLGKLALTNGSAQLTYTRPDHEDLLALYSRFGVASQPSNAIPTTPPRDPNAWHYVGGIPNTPTPGDEQQYSLLDHMRHLLATDPTLQLIGLPGGLDIWLYRNSEKVLEWSSAARDSWPGRTDSIHRQMLRVLEYLDGVAYVFTSGDLPPESPLLVDPTIGRIGLLELNQTQVLRAYLTHVDIHLQGLINAPGHTQAQEQLAIKIDNALKMDASLLRQVHQDAVQLVKMDATQLQSNTALSLLDDMVTNANAAYTGQLDPTTGGDIDGIVWIHQELQGLATLPITTVTNGKR